MCIRDSDVIAGLDARGFILGPPIALALKKPFIMMRKKGKMPNSVQSDAYQTEYGGREGMTVQRDKIKKGDRVLVIDDLVATGGTLSSAISLVHMLGGNVVECACVVELKMFIDPPADSGLPSRKKSFDSLKILLGSGVCSRTFSFLPLVAIFFDDTVIFSIS